MENNENQSLPQEILIKETGTPVRTALPNSTGILVMGILSIVTCCCYGIIGIILAVIALVLAAKATNLFYEYPGTYTEGSLKNVQTGKICAIIGLTLSVLYLAFMIIAVIFYDFGSNYVDWQEMLDQI